MKSSFQKIQEIKANMDEVYKSNCRLLRPEAVADLSKLEGVSSWRSEESTNNFVWVGGNSRPKGNSSDINWDEGSQIRNEFSPKWNRYVEKESETAERC